MSVRLNIRLIGAGVFLTVVYLPVLVLTANAVLDGEVFALIVPMGRRADLLLKSVALAFLTASLGTALSTLIAVVLRGNCTPGKFSPAYLFPAMILVPPYIHSMGWSEFFHQLSTGFSLPDIFGFPAALWVQTLYLLPAGVGIVLLGLASLEGRQIEAALLFSSPRKVWLRIVMPQLRPALVACTGALFVLSLIDYAIPSLFQVNTYAMEIFADFSASHSPWRTFLMSVPLLIITTAALTIMHSGLKSIFLRPSREDFHGMQLPPWPSSWTALKIGGWGLMALQIAVPLWVLLAKTGSVTSLFAALRESTGELGYSLAVALAAVFLTILPALAAASCLVGRDGGNKLWWPILLFPLAIPAPLTGVGLIVLFNQTALGQTSLMPVLASTVRFLPLAALVLAGFLASINPLHLEAGKIFAVSQSHYFFNIFSPLAGGAIVCAGALVFTLSLGELGATLLVAPAGKGTLTMKIYNYLHYGATEAVGGLCLTMLLLVLATLVVGLAWWPRGGGSFLRGWGCWKSKK